MLRFASETGTDFVEVDLVRQEDSELPSKGDGYLTIQVSSAGFTGHNDLWVCAESLRSFCKGVVLLDRDRHGETTIESISPNELTLKICSVNRKGHMAIEGSTGYHVQADGTRFWHGVHFGFKFDPGQLVIAANEEWLKRNALS